MSGMFGEALDFVSKKSVEWYTPKWIFDELNTTFDLDPASPHDMQTEVPAEIKYTIFENGLEKPWFGKVWLNPPYGKETPTWVERMIDHGTGIMLVFSRTDAKWCQQAMRASSAMLFLSGRIDFIPGVENQHKKSRAGAGTVMFAFGEDCARSLARMSGRGIFISKVRAE